MKDRDSPLRVENNPWTLNWTLVEVMQLRGAYVAAMGTIETTLTELAIRASKHESYLQVRAKFPIRRPDRLEYLRFVCLTPGPLEPFKTLIVRVVERFEAGLPMRDMLAHGRMQVLSSPGDGAMIKLDDYSAQGDFSQLRQDNYTIANLRSRVYNLTRLSRAVGKLYWQLGDRLPPIQGDFQGTSPLA